MDGAKVTVTAIGPFFRKGGAPVRRALEGTVAELVDLGQVHVSNTLDVEIYSHDGAHPDRYHPTGHYGRSIHGDPVIGGNTLHGELTDSLVVYGPWLEGVGSRNESSRFKGYHAFRKAFQYLEGIKLAILQKHVGRAVDELN